MKVFPFKTTQRIIIDPGEHYVSRNPDIISTLLGSCVAACLFDPVNRIMGMNHFLLAYRCYDQNSPIMESEEGRYGSYAMDRLIDDMLKLGANRLNLQAKCFGGGNVMSLIKNQEKGRSVGDRNVAFIKEFMQKANIPMVSASLGGNIGRNIHFVGNDYSVFVDEIDQSMQHLLEDDLTRYWKKNKGWH